MDKASASLFFFSTLLALFASSSHAQSCGTYTFINKRHFTSCNDLPVLSSFLHWTYDSSTNSVDLAFRRTGITSSQWIAWALNPSGPQMAGSQCLVAFQNSTGAIRAYTAPIGASEGMPSLREAGLSFGVSNLEATLEGDEMIIFARLQLSNDLLSTNQVWQVGPVNGNSPGVHVTSGDNMRSTASIDFRTGQTVSKSGSFDARQRRRNVHGVLNAVSWGPLMPIGAMMSRYLKVFKSTNPAWFYLHVACQSSAYIVGVAGWATGIKLGNDNPVDDNRIHRNVGIALFALGTLQMFALLWRPKPDHKYRFYWNMYHHSTGYAVVALSKYNVLSGLGILDPAGKWRNLYLGILVVLGVIAAILEVITWTIVVQRKRNSTQRNSPNTNGVNGANGANGYVARAEQEV